METQTATPQADAGTTAAADAAKDAKPRQPKLTVTVDGKTQALLKYPFPVKAATFPVTVNGEAALASCTAGRGKSYTYILFKNTSFYVPGTLPVDAALSVSFPTDYKFDEAKVARVSNYKPKKPAKVKTEGGDAKAEGGETQATAGEPSAASGVVAESSSQEKRMEAQGAKATRRGR